MITITHLNLKKNIPVICDLELHVQPGETYVLLSAKDHAVDHLINIFLGFEKDFEGSVLVENLDILTATENSLHHLTFLSSGNQWPPDMNIGDLLSFFKHSFHIPELAFAEIYVQLNLEPLLHKKIKHLEEMEWRKLLLSICCLKTAKNFLFRDYVKNMPLDFTLEFKKTLGQKKKENCSILYLGDDVFFALEIADRIGFMKKGKLLLELPIAKLKNMDLKELYFQFLVES